MAPQPPAPAAPEAAPAAVMPQMILNETDFMRFVRERTHVEAVDSAKFAQNDLYELPTIPGMNVKEQHYVAGSLKTYERPATIQDVNGEEARGKGRGIRYIWLTKKDMEKTPDFMQNFFIASRDNHVGFETPANMWNSQGIKMVGDHFLCFTSEEYYHKYVASQSARCDGRLESFKPKVRQKDASGKSDAACTQEMTTTQKNI